MPIPAVSGRGFFPLGTASSHPELHEDFASKFVNVLTSFCLDHPALSAYTKWLRSRRRRESYFRLPHNLLKEQLAHEIAAPRSDSTGSDPL
jgi:hypothetical protein